MRVKFNFKMKGDDKEILYPDETTVTSLEKAEEEIKALIKVFNEEERDKYGNTASIREFVRLLLPTKLIEEIIEVVLDNVSCEHQAPDEYSTRGRGGSVDYSLDNEEKVMKKCLEAFLKKEES